MEAEKAKGGQKSTRNHTHCGGVGIGTTSPSRHTFWQPQFILFGKRMWLLIIRGRFHNFRGQQQDISDQNRV